MFTRRTLIITSLGALIIGAFWFALHYQWIIIRLPGFSRGLDNALTATRERRPTNLFFPSHQELKLEKKDIMWSSQPDETCANTITAWLNILEEEGITEKKTILQSATLTPNNDQLIISLDRAPFSSESSTTHKWLVIESLLATLRGACSSLKSVLFLSHHEPMDDYHLDFSAPWPATGFLTTQPGRAEAALAFPIKTPFTIMLDPAGDAQTPGRVIGESFERGITVQYAETIKALLEKNLSNVRVLLTRFPGETLEPLQNAAFSNRLGADLFISIHFYQESEQPAQCSLFYYMSDPASDMWQKRQTPLSWQPYNKAHLAAIRQSAHYAALLYQALKPYYRRGLFKLNDVMGIPCRPLAGVQAPAIMCEIGLHTKDSWTFLTGPVAEGIISIVQTMRQSARTSSTSIAGVEEEQGQEAARQIPA